MTSLAYLSCFFVFAYQLQSLKFNHEIDNIRLIYSSFSETKLTRPRLEAYVDMT